MCLPLIMGVNWMMFSCLWVFSIIRYLGSVFHKLLDTGYVQMNKAGSAFIELTVSSFHFSVFILFLFLSSLKEVARLWQFKEAQNSEETRHEDTLCSLFATSRSPHLRLNPKEECCRVVCFFSFFFFPSCKLTRSLSLLIGQSSTN